MNFFFVLLLLSFKQILAQDFSLSSIIILDNNIPKECGINILINDNKNEFNLKVSIKKTDSGTATFFSSESKSQKIKTSDIHTFNNKIFKIINTKNEYDQKIMVENKTDQDLTSSFFRELLIDGAKVYVNKKTYDLNGPIDSKVRLEYLFCTGEMFLPNYKNNE